MERSGEEFIILQTIDAVKTGESYQRIPPHMTVLSWFVLDRLHIGRIANQMDHLAVEYGALARSARGLKRDMYGEFHDVPVCTMAVETDAIYVGLRELVDELGGKYRYEQFAKTWGPHVSDEPDYAIQPKQLVHFSSLALFSRQDDETGKRKVVEHAVTLKGKL